MRRRVAAQLGEEMHFGCWCNSSPLISGMIKGTVGSALKAELASMTVDPKERAKGINFREIADPAQKKKRSDPERFFSSKCSIGICRLLQKRCLPTDFAEAKQRSDV